MKLRNTIHRMPRMIPGQKLPKAPKQIPWRSGLFLVFIGMLLWGYWYFFWSPAFEVTTVEVIGVPEDVIAPVTNALKHQNMFRLKTIAIEQDIRNIYPPVEKVVIVRGLPHVVRLHIELRDPVLQWQIGEIIYVVDTGGVIFDVGEKAEYASLPKVIDQSGQNRAVGERLVSTTFLEIVQKIPEEIQQRFQKSLERIEITETTFHIDVIIPEGIRLRLTTQRPLDEQLDAASIIIHQHPEAKYIDVRVAKRAYWKP